MEFYTSLEERAKRAEFHNDEFVTTQIQLKKEMQADLIRAIDDLTRVVYSNKERINRLEELFSDCNSEYNRVVYRECIVKHENLSSLASKISEIYLMLLDIYTYGTYSMIVEDEWDWRAFARHLYTMIYEHSRTVNKQMNEIMKIVKDDIDKTYDLTILAKSKKEFTSFIAKNSNYSKLIRVNVDAHFDGNFSERLKIIEDLSFCSVLDLYYAYNTKMRAFLKELKPVLEKIRHSVDTSYYYIRI